MADFFIGRNQGKYKIIINFSLIDIFIDELSPYAKFYGVTFQESSDKVFASVEKNSSKANGVFLKNKDLALSISIKNETQNITSSITNEEWIYANMLLGNFYLSLNDIGKYRPLEINYDKYRVDFDKGCFRGQEIIARMKYLGVDRRKFITIISNKEILSEKKLRILGDKLKYKNFYVYHCSINNDYMSEYQKNNPHVVLV